MDRGFVLIAVIALVTPQAIIAQDCGGEWQSDGDSCYLFRMERIGWRLARQRCIDLISDLVIITSQEENNFLQEKISGSGIEYFWIGLHDTSDEGDFTWVDGTYLSATGFDNFRNGEPNNAELPGEDCGEMSRNTGQWNDETCVDLNGYICERKLNQMIKCDGNNGWHEKNDRCYWWSGVDREVWTDAEEVCTRFGGHVVSIGSQTEQNFIHQIQSFEGLPFWLGLNDRNRVAGDFKWADPSTPYSYQNWGDNEPNLSFNDGSGEANCAQIGVNRVANGDWSTDACSNKHYFLCEKDPGVCPAGWELFNGYCYQMNYVEMTYTSARRYCESEGGHMLTILSDAENQFIGSKLRNMYFSGYFYMWLGISDTVNDNNLLWEDGAPIDYTNWNFQQPNLRDSADDCGEIYTGFSDGKWDTDDCYRLNSFMCKAPVGATINPVPIDSDYGSCEEGWNLFNQSCYFFSEDVQDYGDAITACQAVEAQLTSITSPEEQSFITTRLNFIRANMWVGLSDSRSEGTYEWEDGQTYDESIFSNWAPGEPSDVDWEDCIHLESEYWKLGTWNDIRCSVTHRYICKKGRLPPPPTTPPPTNPPGFEICGEGWILNEANGRCYYINTVHGTVFDEARFACRQYGGDLTSIHSQAENDFLNDNYNRLRDSTSFPFRMFLGLNDQNTEGGFQWSDGSPLNYLNWNSGEPNNAENEDCVEMIADHGKWNDNSCDEMYGYTCVASEYLQTHYNVTRNYGLRYQYQAYYIGVHAEECGRICEAETSFTCLSFDVDRRYEWCQLYDHTKDDPGYDFSYDETYDHYTREFNIPTEAPPVILPDTYGCRDGWTGYGNDCFKLIDTSNEYDVHKATCQNELDGADIVSIPTIHVNNFLNYFIVTEDQKYSYIFIGLTDENQEGVYEWSDGSEVKITLWDAGQPDNDANMRDCTELSADTGRWGDVDCSYYNYAVCKAPKYDTGSVVIEPSPEGCPQGYMRYYFSCYRFVKDVPLTWLDAVSECSNNGEQLVIISSSYENAFVAAQLGLSVEEGLYWTGLSDTKTQGYYQFIDGTVPTYVNWAPGQPNDKTGLCVAMYSGSDTLTGMWTDNGCYVALPYICEKPADGATLAPVTTIPPTLPTDTGCEDDWIGYGESCFLIKNGEENQMNQYDAQTECENIGGYLASFSAPKEEEYLVSRYNALYPGDTGTFWIGLSDENDEGQWFWLDGSPVVYVNWAPGEPNNHQSMEDCVEMSFTGAGWNDASCFKATTSYICERPRDFVVETPPPPVLPDCPSNREWRSGPPYCYYASSPTGEGLNSWQGAENWCRSQGGHLASITSSNEAQIIRGVVDTAVASYWIGLSQTSTGVYQWVDGQPYGYVNWKEGQPNNQNGEESCVQIDTTTGNKWQDRNCGIGFPFICKRAESSIEPIPTPSSAPAGGGCPDDWYFHSGRCYYVGGTEEGDRFDWQTAKAICTNSLVNPGEKGNLATIHSHEEQVLFTSMLKFFPVDVWIGLSDLVIDGQFQWTDQYPVTYTNWKPGKPDNADLNDCVELQNDYDFAGIWSNVRCSNQMGYICQKNADPDLGPDAVEDFGPCTLSGFSDYRAYGESCFKFIPQRMNYEAARQNCLSDGATLASILDTYDQAFIELTLDINKRDDAWIGLTDTNPNQDDVEFAWEDGWPIFFTKWGQGEPSQNFGEGCVYTSAQGGWNNTVCSEQHYSICKTTTAEKPLTVAPVEGECSEGWTDSGSACYWYENTATAVSWAEGRYVCQQAGGDLTSIHSKAENEFIRDLVGTIGVSGRSVWIGLRKNDLGGYDWSDGTALDYTHWDNEEPSDSYRGTPENCGEMYTDQYAKWNDVDCHSRTGYVCKMSKTKEGEEPGTKSPPEPVSGMSSGAIAGIVIGSLILLCMVIFLVYFIFFRGPTTPPPSTTVDIPSGFDNITYKSSDTPTVTEA